MLPIIVRFITNTVTTAPENLTVELVVRITLVYLALRVVDVFGNYYMQNNGHIMGARIEADMRRDLFEKFDKQLDARLVEVRLDVLLQCRHFFRRVNAAIRHKLAHGLLEFCAGAFF